MIRNELLQIYLFVNLSKTAVSSMPLPGIGPGHACATVATVPLSHRVRATQGVINSYN